MSLIRHAFVHLFGTNRGHTRARASYNCVHLGHCAQLLPDDPSVKLHRWKNVDILCGFQCTRIRWSALYEDNGGLCVGNENVRETIIRNLTLCNFMDIFVYQFIYFYVFQ